MKFYWKQEIHMENTQMYKVDLIRARRAKSTSTPISLTKGLKWKYKINIKFFHKSECLLTFIKCIFTS